MLLYAIEILFGPDNNVFLVSYAGESRSPAVKSINPGSICTMVTTKSSFSIGERKEKKMNYYY